MIKNIRVLIISFLIFSTCFSSYAGESKHVNAFYFHSTARCYTCNLIEKYIRETLESNFKKSLSDGKLQFKSINIDESNNKHYIKDYQLFTKTFILSLSKNGKEAKWFNCSKIWHLVRNEDQFKKYIKSEVQKFLEM